MQIRSTLTRMTRAAALSALSLALFAGTASAHTDDHAAPQSLAKPEPRSAPAVARPAKAPARSAPAEQNAHGTKPRSDAAAAAHGAEDATHDTPLQVLKSDVAKSLPMEDSESVPDADTVLKWLRDGNQRWVAGKPMDPNIEPSRRARLAAVGQKPLATIVTCADSRVPADRLFDRGVGELFVIRVAGNIAGDSETGTVEYGVGHLKTPVLIVMGHSKCGAVAAAASGAQLHGKVAQLVSSIVPSVERAKRNNPDLAGDDLVAAAVRENVWQTIYDLFKKSPELAEMARTNQVRVIGAVCDISSGEVEFLGNHPWQAELIDALAAGRAADAENATHATVPDDK
jgi:carbonic anhydrase